MKLADVQIPKEGSRYPHLSLVKLCGNKPIADIAVSLTTEFGQVNVKLYRIIFADGSTLYCEGEHDLPYVTDGSEEVLPDEETLDALNAEENEEDGDDD